MAGAGSDERDEPNLELPSFFGRRKRRRDGEETALDTEAATEPVEVRRAGAEPPPPPEPQPQAEPQPQEESEQPQEEQPATPQPATRRTRPLPWRRGRGPETSYEESPTSVLTATRPADEPRDDDARDRSHGDLAAEGDDRDAGDDGDAGDAPRARRRPAVRLPRLAPRLAAALSGAAAALVLVAIAWLALQGCAGVRGVSSCGGGPGVLALLAAVVAAVLLGAALLRAFGAPQPTGTSVVGVGLLVVVAMLTFPEVAMTTVLAVVALPVASAVTFVVGQVAATAVVDLGD